MWNKHKAPRQLGLTALRPFRDVAQQRVAEREVQYRCWALSAMPPDRSDGLGVSCTFNIFSSGRKSKSQNKNPAASRDLCLVAHVGARWNELVSELERWHAFGKAREMAQTLA